MSRSPQIDDGIERDAVSFQKDIPSKIKDAENYSNELNNALEKNKRGWIPDFLDKKDYEKLFNAYLKGEFKTYVKKKQQKFTDIKVSFGQYKSGSQKGYQFESLSGKSKETGKRQFVGRFVYFVPKEKVKVRLTAQEYKEKLMIYYDKLEAKPFRIEKEGRMKGYSGYSYSGIDLKTKKRQFAGRFFATKKIKVDGYEWIDRRKELQQKKYRVKNE